MKYKVDHDYHIHTQLSLCSGNKEQTTERLLQSAKENSFESICVTDHYWDSTVSGASEWYAQQDFEHVSKALPLPSADGISFLFGCETEMRKDTKVCIPEFRYKDFDFIIVPTTHLHMTDYTITREDAASTERRAELWVERFDALMDQPLPWGKVGVAHLTTVLINYLPDKREHLKVLDMISDEDMERLFARAAKIGLGIELNYDDMKFTDSTADTILRPYRIAKSHGCKFYLGSDAHGPSVFASVKDVFERAVRTLDLTENDKFHIS